MTDVLEENGDESFEEQLVESEEEELIMNPLRRALMVLFSPRLVFESVAAKSSRLDWLVPITISILFSLIFINTGFEYLRNDQHAAAIERIENNTSLSDEQKAAGIENVEQAMEKMGGFSRIISNIAAIIGSFVSAAVIALALLAVTNLMLKASVSFGNAFKVCALGLMTGVVSSIVRLPLVFYFESVSQAKLSLVSLLPEGMGEAFLVKVLDFDIFTLWYAIVISIGIAVFAKTSTAKTFMPICAMWLVYRIAALSLSGAMAGLGG